jgi:pentapeptide MXKDX repeat protein
VFSKPGIEWNGMKLTFQENKKPGIERNGMERNGMERNGMERNGMERNGMERNGMERNGMERNGMERNGKKWKIMDNKCKFIIFVRYAKITIIGMLNRFFKDFLIALTGS